VEINRKRVLVTGGAGFIGSHLSEGLLKLGAKVTALDNLDDFYQGKEANLEGLLGNERFRLVRGSILDLDLLQTLIKDADAVVHLAGQAGIRYCNDHPFKANSVNATGTLNVVVTCQKLGVRKMVYASSSSVFGDPVRIPMDELHPTDPNSGYGASKLAGEKYCMSFAKAYGMDISCLRYFSVYGPRGRPDQVLYSFAKKVSAGEPPVIYGDGSYSRDFTYVSDVVGATILSLYSDSGGGRVLNIGYGRDFKMIEVARKIIAHYGGKFEPKFVEQYEGDFSRTLCDNNLAKRTLGWRPEVSFDDGLVRFLRWFDENRSAVADKEGLKLQPAERVTKGVKP
jgi:UDP-glucose 4-epimerase